MRAAAELCRQYDLLPRGGHVLCAVSGGADSVCLLHWLSRERASLGFTLTAAHYNHCLRGAESDRDEAFVRSFVGACCPAVRLPDGRGAPAVELIVGSGDVAAEAARCRQGLEETARRMRYEFLEQTARAVGADVIATAHNAEDNAETMLLHLLRGSGLRGLTGIPPRRGRLVRPLLTTTRGEILAYLDRYGLPHVEDSSNADDRFARNRLRHTVLPALAAAEPQFARRFADAARLLSEDEQCLNALAARALEGAVESGASVRVPARAVAALDDALAVRAVRLLIARLTGGDTDCARAHLQAVVGLCRGASPSARLSLPRGMTARRVYGELELTLAGETCGFAPAPLPLPGALTVPWGTLEARQIRYGGQPPTGTDFYLTCEAVTVRPRRTGDRLRRPGRPEASLKKLMIDEKIPRHVRDLLPVLDAGGGAAAAVGLGQQADLLPAVGERCWHITATQAKEKGSL